MEHNTTALIGFQMQLVRCRSSLLAVLKIFRNRTLVPSQNYSSQIATRRAICTAVFQLIGATGIVTWKIWSAAVQRRPRKRSIPTSVSSIMVRGLNCRLSGGGGGGGGFSHLRLQTRITFLIFEQTA